MVVQESAIEVNEVTNFNANVVVKADVTTTGSFIIGSASMNETDLEKLDGITNGAGAAKVFCPVPLLLLAIVLCLLGGLRSCFCNGATTSPPQNQQETLGRDSTAETATLAGRSMKDASDSSYP